MARASQVITKPANLSADMVSLNTNSPTMNEMVGLKYCSIPSLESGTRIAANPKSNSGSEVTMPALASHSECEMPNELKVLLP